MSAISPEFDLVVAYPQWQGSGRPENIPSGAAATAEVCRRFGPLVAIGDEGEGLRHEGVNHWTAIAKQFEAARDILRKHQPRRVLVAGGDCACDIAVIDYLSGQHPDLMVIWVDAHLDANTPETSPSGNLHGMPVAAMMGYTSPSMSAMLSSPIKASQLRYFGAHEGDRGDWAFQREHAIEWLDPTTLPERPIHIHFDLDALDRVEFPHAAYPEGKLPKSAALDLVRKVAATGMLVGLTITEFAPADEIGKRDGASFITSLCEAASGRDARGTDPPGTNRP